MKYLGVECKLKFLFYIDLVDFSLPNEAVCEDSGHPDDEPSPEGPPKGVDMDPIVDLTGQPECEGIDHQEEEA